MKIRLKKSNLIPFLINCWSLASISSKKPLNLITVPPWCIFFYRQKQHLQRHLISSRTVSRTVDSDISSDKPVHVVFLKKSRTDGSFWEYGGAGIKRQVCGLKYRSVIDGSDDISGTTAHSCNNAMHKTIQIQFIFTSNIRIANISVISVTLTVALLLVPDMVLISCDFHTPVSRVSEDGVKTKTSREHLFFRQKSIVDERGQKGILRMVQS